MPRKPRFFVPGVPAHLVQRGNNRGAIFFGGADQPAYLDALRASAERYGVRIHAYVLMSNHVHLLVTPAEPDSIGRMMQYLGREYVTKLNGREGRSGTLWERRYRASSIEGERYLLACMRYIELNPVRAGMVADPEDYTWSSFGANALGRLDELLDPHPVYLALGTGTDERLVAYRELFAGALAAPSDEPLRMASRSGTPLGAEGFITEIERTLGRGVGFACRGRPLRQRT